VAIRAAVEHEVAFLQQDFGVAEGEQWADVRQASERRQRPPGDEQGQQATTARGTVPAASSSVPSRSKAA
jgi:hypothetical protein